MDSPEALEAGVDVVADVAAGAAPKREEVVVGAVAAGFGAPKDRVGAAVAGAVAKRTLKSVSKVTFSDHNGLTRRRGRRSGSCRGSKERWCSGSSCIMDVSNLLGISNSQVLTCGGCSSE